MNEENNIVELPKFTALVNKRKAKKCRCYPRNYIVDITNRELTCEKCGNFVDPYEALWEMADNASNYKTQFIQMKEDAGKWLKNNRHLLVLKKLEENYCRGTRRPFCPHCNKPFDFSDLKSWSSKEYAEAFMKKGKENL